MKTAQITVILFCLILLSNWATLTAQETVEGDRYALLVGVNKYLDKTNFSSLEYAESDIELIRDRLIHVLHFKPENITVLTTQSDALNSPLRENVENELQTKVKQGKKGDIIFFMYAGHGFEKNGEDWLCPLNGYYDQADTTALSVNKLMKMLDRSDATFKLMVVDACRENPAMRRGGETIAPYRTIENPPKGLLLYQSCQKGEYAHSDPAIEHGIFSHYFAESFEKGDENSDGILTFFDVIKYTDQRVRTHVQRLFHNEYQQPSINTDGLNDFIISDNLLIENLPLSVWEEADAVYQEACALRTSRKYAESRTKIKKALEITKNASPNSHRRAPYVLEEVQINSDVLQEAEAESARAMTLYEEEKYEEALEAVNASLALKDTVLSQRLKKQIEEKIKAGGELPEEYLNSQGQRLKLIPAGEFMMGDTLTPEEVDKKYPGGC